MGATLIRRTWHGDEILARSRRANGRAIIGMGEGASAAMKTNAHVVSGDLKRSVHVASVTGSPNPTARETLIKRDDWMIEVGSWLPYACVENNRGGAHRFADNGWQQAQPTFRLKLDRAWREEGL